MYHPTLGSRICNDPGNEAAAIEAGWAHKPFPAPVVPVPAVPKADKQTAEAAYNDSLRERLVSLVEYYQESFKKLEARLAELEANQKPKKTKAGD